MRIGELSRRTGVPARLLRYYEEQGMLHAERDEYGYRAYDHRAILRVHQIRGLLASGLPTRIIRLILPHLDRSEDGQLRPADIPGDIADLMERELDKLQARISSLTRDRDSILSYLRAIPKR